jgi:diaminopimelate decarboxylase
MEKKISLTKSKIEAIINRYPTPFHLYDEKNVREAARKLISAFSWAPGFKEYFAVKATPNPEILKILAQEGCGTDCSSLSELILSERVDITG